MNRPAVTYTARPDTTPEAGLSALATVYRFVFDCYEAKKNAAGVTSTNGDDVKESESELRRRTSIPETI